MPRCWCCSRVRGGPAIRRPARRRRPAGHRAGLDAAPPRRPGRVPRRSGRPRRRRTRCTPRCGKPTRRQVSTPGGFTRCARWSGCSSRRPASTSYRCWPTHRIPGRWPSSTKSETAIVARVPVRAFINPENRIMVYRKDNHAPLRRPGFPAQRDAGVGVHRPGDLRDARRGGLGAAMEHRRRPRTRRRNGPRRAPGELR